MTKIVFISMDGNFRLMRYDVIATSHSKAKAKAGRLAEDGKLLINNATRCNRAAAGKERVKTIIADLAQ